MNISNFLIMPQHIKRLIIVFIVVIGLFLLIRWMLIPESFGEYGYYRGHSLEEIANLPLHFAGSASCSRCHQDIIRNKNAGHHAKLACEGCHGPAYKHTLYADSTRKNPLPDSLKLERNTARKYCAGCHEFIPARFKLKSDTVNFSVIKMIVEMKHNRMIDKSTKEPFKCIDCHNPHDP